MQIGYKNFCEPQFIEKKQGVVSENTTPLQIGWRDDGEIQRKSDQIYNILVSHYSEILAMREQVQLIRGFLAA